MRTRDKDAVKQQVNVMPLREATLQTLQMVSPVWHPGIDEVERHVDQPTEVKTGAAASDFLRHSTQMLLGI